MLRFNEIEDDNFKQIKVHHRLFRLTIQHNLISRDISYNNIRYQTLPVLHLINLNLGE